MKKITKREMFNGVINYIESGNFKIEGLTADKAIEMLTHELELLERKNSSEKKPTAQQVANDTIRQAIYDGMEVNRLYTITEIQKSIPECAEMTNQRISALIRKMKEDGLIERIEEKRKALFKAVK